MKKAALILFIGLCLMMNCFIGLTSSQAQKATILIERTKLEKLAAEAEKAQLYRQEGENLMLENHSLKQRLSTTQNELEEANKDLGHYRTKWRYALIALVVGGVFIVVLLVRK